ncbi:hypothetical protein CAOG_08935 [Capsaspora owczarzaki ATCC 30864]|uniref:Uncharacterized protein n=2 Tax=Capsaspora owczarzaki (strain ATCC 30864) TaxID=595528 RepID=A0A0D2VVW8_CAPO3|nr:hypothetical protein CAOG_08935 [Capsaspora owczarzaki ATCC 30864]KJE95617.1 hypothetical protein CAOG_008935 [Capsaspora owczarzaki ATCC 30864]|eukprot:XP_011270606.1 hypothetical protein CAOG_08935 [Capsaspora owczarzaki ATCC 30864]
MQVDDSTIPYISHAIGAWTSASLLQNSDHPSVLPSVVLADDLEPVPQDSSDTLAMDTTGGGQAVDAAAEILEEIRVNSSGACVESDEEDQAHEQASVCDEPASPAEDVSRVDRLILRAFFGDESDEESDSEGEASEDQSPQPAPTRARIVELLNWIPPNAAQSLEGAWSSPKSQLAVLHAESALPVDCTSNVLRMFQILLEDRLKPASLDQTRELVLGLLDARETDADQIRGLLPRLARVHEQVQVTSNLQGKQVASISVLITFVTMLNSRTFRERFLPYARVAASDNFCISVAVLADSMEASCVKLPPNAFVADQLSRHTLILAAKVTENTTVNYQSSKPALAHAFSDSIHAELLSRAGADSAIDRFDIDGLIENAVLQPCEMNSVEPVARAILDRLRVKSESEVKTLNTDLRFKTKASLIAIMTAILIPPNESRYEGCLLHRLQSEISKTATSKLNLHRLRAKTTKNENDLHLDDLWECLTQVLIKARRATSTSTQSVAMLDHFEDHPAALQEFATHCNQKAYKSAESLRLRTEEKITKEKYEESLRATRRPPPRVEIRDYFDFGCSIESQRTGHFDFCDEWGKTISGLEKTCVIGKIELPDKSSERSLYYVSQQGSAPSAPDGATGVSKVPVLTVGDVVMLPICPNPKDPNCDCMRHCQLRHHDARARGTSKCACVEREQRFLGDPPSSPSISPKHWSSFLEKPLFTLFEGSGLDNRIDTSTMSAAQVQSHHIGRFRILFESNSWPGRGQTSRIATQKLHITPHLVFRHMRNVCAAEVVGAIELVRDIAARPTPFISFQKHFQIEKQPLKWQWNCLFSTMPYPYDMQHPQDRPEREYKLKHMQSEMTAVYKRINEARQQQVSIATKPALLQTLRMNVFEDDGFARVAHQFRTKHGCMDIQFELLGFPHRERMRKTGFGVILAAMGVDVDMDTTRNGLVAQIGHIQQSAGFTTVDPITGFPELWQVEITAFRGDSPAIRAALGRNVQQHCLECTASKQDPSTTTFKRDLSKSLFCHALHAGVLRAPFDKQAAAEGTTDFYGLQVPTRMGIPVISAGHFIEPVAPPRNFPNISPSSDASKAQGYKTFRSLLTSLECSPTPSSWLFLPQFLRPGAEMVSLPDLLHVNHLGLAKAVNLGFRALLCPEDRKNGFLSAQECNGLLAVLVNHVDKSGLDSSHQISGSAASFIKALVGWEHFQLAQLLPTLFGAVSRQFEQYAAKALGHPEAPTAAATAAELTTSLGRVFTAAARIVCLIMTPKCTQAQRVELKDLLIDILTNLNSEVVNAQRECYTSGAPSLMPPQLLNLAHSKKFHALAEYVRLYEIYPNAELFSNERFESMHGRMHQAAGFGNHHNVAATALGKMWMDYTFRIADPTDVANSPTAPPLSTSSRCAPPVPELFDAPDAVEPTEGGCRQTSPRLDALTPRQAEATTKQASAISYMDKKAYNVLQSSLCPPHPSVKEAHTFAHNGSMTARKGTRVRTTCGLHVKENGFVKIRIDTRSYLGKFLFGYRLTNAPPDAFTDWACVELLHRVDSVSLFRGGKAVSEYACRAKFLVPATTLVAPLSTMHACFHHMCNLPQDDKKQIKFSLVKHNHADRVVLMPTARNVLRPELELDARLEDDVESDFGFQMPGHPSGKSVSAAELSLLFSPLDPVTRRNMAAMKARWTAPAQAPAAGAPAQHSPAGAPARASHASVSHVAHTAHAPAPHAGSRSHDSGSAEPMQVDQAERTPLSALGDRPSSSVSHAGHVQPPHTVRRDCATRSARPPQTPPGRPSAQQAASAGLTELVQRPRPILMKRLWASMWTDPPEAIEAELAWHPRPRILAYRWLMRACQPLQFTPLRVSPTIPAATQPPDNVSAESTQPPTELSAEPMALIPATAQPPVNSSVESTASISAAAQPAANLSPKALQTVQEFLQLYDRSIPIKLNSPGIDASEHLPARQVLKPFDDKGSEWMSAEALDFCFGRLQQANITSQNGVKVTFWV